MEKNTWTVEYNLGALNSCSHLRVRNVWLMRVDFPCTKRIAVQAEEQSDHG